MALTDERVDDMSLQKTNTSRQHLYVVTNLSEHDDDPVEHFHQERLQSIFQN